MYAYSQKTFLPTAYIRNTQDKIMIMHLFFAAQ